MNATPLRIDGLQYCNWSREIFLQMREGGLTAVHATVSYHENFRQTVRLLVDWRQRFREHGDLIVFARESADLATARQSGRTAIFLGLQTPMPIEDDIGLIEILFELGVRFQQITYNNQSLLGCGWLESEDSGVTRMGREAITEMNRIGMVIDVSHAGERTTLETIELSRRPVVISHANPRWLRDTARNVSKRVMQALAERGGMLGLSLYPAHLPAGGATTLRQFAEMAAQAAEIVGVKRLGIGSDLCQNQPDSVVRWMREGRWTRPGAEAVTFPEQPQWFRSNLDFAGLAEGLAKVGFHDEEIAQVLGGAWADFIAENVGKPG